MKFKKVRCYKIIFIWTILKHAIDLLLTLRLCLISGFQDFSSSLFRGGTQRGLVVSCDVSAQPAVGNISKKVKHVIYTAYKLTDSHICRHVLHN